MLPHASPIPPPGAARSARSPRPTRSPRILPPWLRRPRLRGKDPDRRRDPAIGTSWDDAKQQLQPLWPVMASSDFVNWGTAKRVAYFWKDGAVQQDEAHDPPRASGSICSNARASWMPQDGEHINVSVTDLLYGTGAGAVDSRGLGGPRLLHPGRWTRCAVLIFEPKDGGHVLTGAYGVIEQPAATSAEAAVTTFLGDAVNRLRRPHHHRRLRPRGHPPGQKKPRSLAAAAS